MTMPRASLGSIDGRQRLLIIGLDGATFDVLLPMMDAGIMPNLKAIADSGTSSVLESTVPPLSGPAWTAFLTGKQAGKNGVFHFFERDGRGERFSKSRIVSSTSIQTPTLWDWLGRFGRQIVSINMPMTYPPRPVNGLLISGVLTPPGAKLFTYPRDLADSLPGYRVDFDYWLADGLFDGTARPDAVRILEDQTALLAIRRAASVQLMQDFDWDCFAVVISGTDRIGHYLWDYLVDAPTSCGQVAEKVRAYFLQLDQVIGQLRGVAGEKTPVILVSDHGMGPAPKRTVHLADWLLQHGLLVLRSKHSLVSILKSLGLSKEMLLGAFRRVLRPATLHRVRSFSSGLQPKVSTGTSLAVVVPLYDSWVGIDLLVGGSADGADEETQRREVADWICEHACEIIDPDTHRPVVERVFRRSELFSGPLMDPIPDLLLVLKPGYRASSSVGHATLVSPYWPSPTSLPGAHHNQGIFMGCGYPLRNGGFAGESLSLQDVMPTILYLLGVPIPDDVDGEVIVDLFEDSFVRDHEMEAAPADWEAGARSQGVTEYSQEETQALEERLCGLGYC